MLSDRHLDQWATRGWIVVPGAFTPDHVARIDRWIGDVESWSSGGGPGLHHFEQTEHGPRIARSEDFEPHHPELASVLRAGTIPDTLAAVLGEPVTLFKEKVNYKHPGGAGFAPHQDATAYRFVDHHVSCMVPLDPATEASGCLYFAPVVPHTVLPNTDGRIDPEWVATAPWEPAEVEPGDLVVFDSYTPHHSGTNTTNRSRRAMYLTYNAASRGDFRDRYYDDKRALLADADDAGAERVRISVNDDFLGVPVASP
ncbi:MAG: phytanoyl-CoA dioxygenase family protein [Actinomycetota bacterium]